MVLDKELLSHVADSIEDGTNETENITKQRVRTLRDGWEVS